MRISSVVIPFIVFLAGIAGSFLRTTELAIIFDSYSGLPEHNAFITLVLMAFSSLFFFITILFSIRTTVKNAVSDDYDNAFGTDSFAHPATFMAISTVWLVATIVYFLERFSMVNTETIDYVFAGASSLSAVFLMIFAIEVYKNPRRKFLALLSVVPTLFMCFWLVLIYRDNASNPVLIEYAYFCLALVFSATGMYFSSGFAIGRPVIGKAIVSYTGAAYFCMVTLADNHSMSIKLIIGVIAFMNLFNLSSLLRNLQKKRRRQAE